MANPVAVDWDVVKIALEKRQTNEAAAVNLLMAAIDCAPEKCAPGCCSGDGKPDETPGGGETPTTGETAVIYGKGGYTDSGDPRTPACKTHEFDGGGKPIAVHTAVMVRPQSRYRCTLVDLIPHDESCQIYIEVYDRNGNPASKNGTRQLTGWSESEKYDELIAAPASPGNLPMGRGSKFWPPALGGSGACIVNEQGEIDSDIVGSLGLSRGEHMSYRVAYRARW